jgi:hypothetical protein
MEDRIVERIALENGLVLEMHDRSKCVAGDRWRVSFEARLDIPVEPDFLGGQSSEGLSYEAVRDAVGERVVYTYEKVRNFIEADEKDKVFNDLKDRFLKNALAYVSSSKFRRNIIVAEYRKATGELSWKR